MTGDNSKDQSPLSAAEIGALAHLYRGEIYRSTTWRTRLDATTNWAVVTTGIALSVAYSSPSASPLPLVLVGLLLGLFLILEARRYRFFDMWRLRTRVLENHFFGPILDAGGADPRSRWRLVLREDYDRPVLHVSLLDAVGRRLRRNFGWIFLIQMAAYLGKLLIHPATIQTIEDLWARAAIGPLSGQLVLLIGLVFHIAWITIALTTRQSRRGVVRGRPRTDGPDQMLELSNRG